jgi:epoxide hydrolase
VTTCYQLLVGALPDLRVDELVRRLECTAWPTFPDNAAEAPRRYASEWMRWARQPEQAALGRHETVDGVHTVRFAGSGRVPLLLLHGWPTSFLAFHRVIEPLRAVGSEVVLASLPGFGPSALQRPDWSVKDTAALLTAVMVGLGHDRFVVHGQDWGSVLAREIGAHAPDRVVAVHVSAGLRGFIGEVPDVPDYLRLQTRRPDSLAFALADSPAGLLAWQLDKYQIWQAALGENFNLGIDFILANATLYWLTGSIGTSMRMYSANRDVPVSDRSAVPTGVSVFGTGDFASRTVAARENNLVAFYEHPTGGHVAALDAPAEFVADLTDLIDRTGELR